MKEGARHVFWPLRKRFYSAHGRSTCTTFLVGDEAFLRKGGDSSPPKKKLQFVSLPLALLHPRKRSLCGFGQAAHATPGLYQKLSVPNHLFKINSVPKMGIEPLRRVMLTTCSPLNFAESH